MSLRSCPAAYLARLAVAAASLGGLGCAQQGRLLVVVDSDMTVPNELDSVRLIVSRDGRPSVEESFDLAETAFPVRVGVEPIGGSDLVRIEAWGRLRATDVVAAAALVNVVPGPVPTLRLRLDASCRLDVVTCPADETCMYGGCHPVIALDAQALCDPVAQQGCPADHECAVVATSGGGAAAVSQSGCIASLGSGTHSTACADEDDCAAGYTCVDVGGRQTCFAYCELGTGRGCLGGACLSGLEWRVNGVELGLCAE